MIYSSLNLLRWYTILNPIVNIEDIRKVVDTKVSSINSISEYKEKSILIKENPNYSLYHLVDEFEEELILKISNDKEGISILEAEKRSIEIIKHGDCQTLDIKNYISERKTNLLSFTRVKEGNKDNKFWENLAEQLVILHQNKSRSFGLDHDNYIGTIKQFNSQMGSWMPFFRDRRMRPMVHLAYRLGVLKDPDLNLFDKLYNRLENFFSYYRPSLVHGDFRVENSIGREDQKAILIDPAVYYGIPEMDLASALFHGSFPEYFFDAYENMGRLEKDWKERAGLLNIYPMMVYTNTHKSEEMMQKVRDTILYYI